MVRKNRTSSSTTNWQLQLRILLMEKYTGSIPYSNQIVRKNRTSSSTTNCTKSITFVMCAAAWSELPNKASIGTLSRGGWFVTLAWLLDHGPNPPCFDLMPSFGCPSIIQLAATHYQDAMCVAAWSNSPNEASIGTLSRGGGLVVIPWPKPSLF